MSKIVNESCNLLLVVESIFKHIRNTLPFYRNLCNWLKLYLNILRVKIVHKDTRVVLLLFKLNEEPVCNSLMTLCLSVQRH